MLNGRCKVWKDENGNFHAELLLDTPKGVIKMQRSAGLADSVGAWDPTSPETGPGTLIKKKVEYIAGFFPVENAVGQKAVVIASELLRRRTSPETAELATRQINAVKAAAIAGDDEAFDIDYALRRMVKGAKRTQLGSAYSRGVLAGDDAETSDTFDASLVGPQTEIGWKIKIGKPKFAKLAKWAKKNPIKAVASAVLPPVAAYNLIRSAKKRSPAAVKKVAEIRNLALGRPVALSAPVPTAPVVSAAQMALENLRKADAFEEEGIYPQPQPTYEQPAYEQSESSYSQEEYPSEYSEEYYEDSTEGDAIGSFLGNLKKKLGGALKAIDPTRPGSFTAPLLSNLPFVGPGVKASLDLLNQAKKLNPSAIEKIKTVKSLADAGVPKAMTAKANLTAAQELSKEAERLAAQGASTGKASKVGNWFPFIGVYRAGLTRNVA